MSDSSRWCAICKAWGRHHTDRHDQYDDDPREGLPTKSEGLGWVGVAGAVAVLAVIMICAYMFGVS